MIMDEEDYPMADSAHVDMAYSAQHDKSLNMSTNDLLAMTVKVPPAFNGVISWFQYEERVDEWCDITNLTPRR